MTEYVVEGRPRSLRSRGLRWFGTGVGCLNVYNGVYSLAGLALGTRVTDVPLLLEVCLDLLVILVGVWLLATVGERRF